MPWGYPSPDRLHHTPLEVHHLLGHAQRRLGLVEGSVLLEGVVALYDSGRPDSPQQLETPIDPETEEALRSLGYLR